MRGSGRQLFLLAVLAAGAFILAACYQHDPAITGVESVEFSEPSAVEPGSILGLGEAVWVEQSSGGSTTLLGVAVLDIVQGEPWFWSNYANPDDLVDLTPFFVLVQRQWIDPERKFDISLYPVLGDGSPAYLMETDTMGAIDDASCEGIGVPQLPDPRQRIDCLVVAAPVGERVVAVLYDGTFSDPTATLDPTPYLAAPVVWTDGSWPAPAPTAP